jgi:hypothetical protein
VTGLPGLRQPDAGRRPELELGLMFEEPELGVRPGAGLRFRGRHAIPAVWRTGKHGWWAGSQGLTVTMEAPAGHPGRQRRAYADDASRRGRRSHNDSVCRAGRQLARLAARQSGRHAMPAAKHGWRAGSGGGPAEWVDLSIFSFCWTLLLKTRTWIMMAGQPAVRPGMIQRS